MENIISRIIELDRQSDLKIQEAQKRREQIISEANVEAVEIKNASLERSKKHMDRVDEVERTAAEIRISELNEEKNRIIAEYDSVYDANHEQWEDEFVSHIIG